jgi:hypothetical protein
MTNKESTPVKVLFPEEEVELWPGHMVKVRPLSLEDLPKVIKSFTNIMDNYAEMENMSVIEMGSTVAKSLIELIPFCIGIPSKEIPLAAIPDLINVIRAQNFPPESMGKWKALFAEVTAFLPEQGQKEET